MDPSVASSPGVVKEGKIEIILFDCGLVGCFLPYRHSLPFYGSLQFRVAAGVLDLCGHTFYPSEKYFKVHSPTYTSPYCFACNHFEQYIVSIPLEKEEDEASEFVRRKRDVLGAVVIVKELMEHSEPNLRQIVRHLKATDYDFELSTAKFIVTKRKGKSDDYLASISINEGWQDIFDEISDRKFVDARGNQRILITGGKGVGKSSFAMLLVNYLLSRKAYTSDSRVFVVDLDLGQTMFTPPGLVSLVEIAEPVLGPPEFRLGQTNSGYRVVYSAFHGDLHARDKPFYYEACMNRIAHIVSSAFVDSTFIFNTMGWIKGFGLELLKMIRNMYSPTLEARLNPEGVIIDESEMADSPNAIVLPSSSIGIPPNRISAAALRDLVANRYFEAAFEEFAPISVSLDRIKIRIDSEQWRWPRDRFEMVLSLLHSVVGLLDESLMCHGLGYVLDVDLDSRGKLIMSILTPIAAESLNKINVQYVERASFTLDQRFICRYSLGTPSFISTSPINAEGGLLMKSRRNLKRRR